jgi:C4-dicarboxylate-specific signal transduction histidine kinase
LALPLRRQIAILNLAILGAVAVVTGWAARQTYREQIEQLEVETKAMAATIVVYLERRLDIQAVQTIISAIALPSGTVITVTNERSIVLARSTEAESYVGRATDAVPRRIDEVPPFAVRVGVDGVERVYANAVYGAGPWLVSVGIPTAVAYDRVYAIVLRNVSIALGVAILVVALQFVLLRSYTKAFDRARQSAARVAAGDLDLPEPITMPSREMEQVQAAFIEMLAKLRESQRALAAQVADERHMREELQSLQRHVIRQERLAAIGVLVSGVAHELNNPLQAILGFADLLQIRADLPADAMADLALIQKESARATAIIRNLSRFTRQQTAEPSPVRLGDVVASVVELRQRLLDEASVTLEIVEHSNPSVVAVFAELQQVVLNLMINAEQALADVPPPRVISIDITEGQGRARLEMRDGGPGVPPDHEAKLFQPFFTTKPVGKGTGLGLSVSYGIIQSHGGTIGYQRASNGGALFFFELPVVSTQDAA